MAEITQPLTADALREFADYDPTTGVFSRRSDGRRIGYEVPSKGYVCAKVFGKKYNAHRLAWLHVHGEWPKHEIDHVNGVRTDNRIENLRDVPRGINSQNQRRAQRDNSTGLLGVSIDRERGKFKATIRANGVVMHLGRFNTGEEAHARYLAEKRRIHAGCTI
jgi:hypothetical protein